MSIQHFDKKINKIAVIIHGVLLIVASKKTYLLVWAGFGIYDRKGPVQYSHD
jgi:hypothetical protein